MLLDEMKEELIKRGLHPTQTTAKAIPHVMDIMTQDDKYWDLVRIDEEIRSQEKRAERARAIADGAEKRAAELMRASLKGIKNDKEYIANFYKALFDCDTAEAKDNMKAAQVFINSVNVNTVYDNTAFIIGLVAILSGGKVGAMEELHKLNTKMPSPSDLAWDEAMANRI